MIFDLRLKLWRILYQNFVNPTANCVCVENHGKPINQLDAFSHAFMHTILLIRHIMEFTYSFGASHLIVFDWHKKYIDFRFCGKGYLFILQIICGI